METSEQKFERSGSNRLSRVDIWEKSIPVTAEMVSGILKEWQGDQWLELSKRNSKENEIRQIKESKEIALCRQF